MNVEAEDAQLGELLERHVVPTRPSGAWEFCFHEQGLMLLRSDGYRVVLSREELASDKTVAMIGMGRRLPLEHPEPAVVPLTGPATDALRRLLDPVIERPFMASLRALAIRALVMGLVLIAYGLLVQLPVYYLVSGCLWLGVWFAGRFARHRAALLLEAILWGSLGASHAVQLLNGQWFSVVPIAVAVWSATAAYRSFTFFGAPVPLRRGGQSVSVMPQL